MNMPTDYQVELVRLDHEIAELEGCGPAGQIDSDRARRLVYSLYRRASLTGNHAEFAVAETAIDNALQRSGPWPDLCLLKANLDFTLHRLASSRADLALAPGLADCSEGRALTADLDLQEGRYEDAQRGYERLIEDHRTWDNLARLAYLKAKFGDVAGAEQLYIESEDEITAKEMRSYAWVELQRGLLSFTRGCYDTAWTHYQRAAAAYSGYWLVDEHIAELLAAQGKCDQAVALYEDVLARVPRPDLEQALGDLYALMGRPNLAAAWHEKALAAYLDSARRGQVQYLHHLADFYADVRQDGAEAVRWARKDLALRQNFSTYAALAWGLYRDGQIGEALDAMHRALSSGVRDAELFYQAAMIHLAAGRAGQGNVYLHRASEINPRYQDFHVHH